MSPLRVFVVDPDEQRGAWLERMVAAQGHDVERFSNGEKAIDRFVQKPADAVLVEYVLPGRDGVATVEAIRWAPGGRDVRVILLAREEPVSAPLSMLALRVDALASLVGDLDPAVVEQALADLDREWNDEGTLAIENEGYAKDLFEAKRKSAVPTAPAPAVQEWLDAATVIAGAVRVETVEAFGDEPTTRGEDASLARAMLAADRPLATFDDVTSTEPGEGVGSAATVSARPLDANDARAILGISGGKIVSRPFARPSPPGGATRFAAARGAATSFRAPSGAVRITGALASPPSTPEPSPRMAAAEPAAREAHVPETQAPREAHAASPGASPSGTVARPRSEERATAEVPPDPHTIDEGRFVRAQARRSQAAEWSGSFVSAPFPSLLRRIADERASGGLVCTLPPPSAPERPRPTRTTVDGDMPTKVVFFRGGVPVHVRSNLVDECLGQLLVRKKRIGAATLEESIRRMREGGGLQGQILVDMGALSPIELGELLSEQVRQKLFDLFGWRKGEHRFSSTLEAPRDGVALEMALPDMVYEGVCAAMPATLLLDIMTPRLDLYVVPDPVRLARFARVRVSRDLRTVLERLDGSLRLRDVLRLGQRPGAIAQLVYALECLSALSYEVSPHVRRVVLAPLSMEQAVAAAEEVMREATPEPPRDPSEDALWDDVTNERDDRAAAAHAHAVHRSAEPANVASHRAAMAQAPTAQHVSPPQGAPLGVPTAPTRATPAYAPPLAGPPRHTPPEIAALPSVSLSSLVELRSPMVSLSRDDPGAAVTGPRAPVVVQGDPRGLDAHVDRMFEAERCFRRGNRSLARGDVRDALGAFERAVELCPEEGEFVAYLGWARHGTEPTSPRATEAALADLARSTMLAPDLHVTHLLHARVLEHAGRQAQALQAYREVLALEPGMREAEDAVARLGRRWA